MYKRKFISIEPIMDFDLNTFADMIEDVAPEQVAVGYDNYHNHLPEPSLSKTVRFIEKMSRFTNFRKRTLRQAYSRQQSVL